MPQMYRVKFALNGEGTVETGEAIVNADSKEGAESVVAQMCNLPRTMVQFETARVKPAFVLLRRANVERHIATFEAKTVAETVACRATFPRSDRLEREIFRVQAYVELRADNETDAIQGTARAIVRHSVGERQRLSLRSFDITCDKVQPEDRVSRFDENAALTTHRFVQGGSVRPR